MATTDVHLTKQFYQLDGFRSKEVFLVFFEEGVRRAQTFKLGHDHLKQISDTLCSESINNVLFLILFKSAATTECMFLVNSVTHCFILCSKRKALNE